MYILSPCTYAAVVLRGSLQGSWQFPSIATLPLPLAQKLASCSSPFLIETQPAMLGEQRLALAEGGEAPEPRGGCGWAGGVLAKDATREYHHVPALTPGASRQARVSGAWA